MIREIECGDYADGANMTVASLCARWLAATEHRVSARTYERYASIVKLHLVPALGGVRAQALSSSHIENALASWITGPRKDREKGRLSPRTVKHLLDTLRGVCRWGVRMRVLTRNPVDAVEPPRVPRIEMRALDPDGVAELLRSAAGTDLELPISVAVGTGLRRGELLGLRWSDVDVERKRLVVRRSVETVKGVTRTKEPKTARSARTISLPSFVVQVLRRVRAEQIQRRLLLGLGREFDGDGWVFSRDGTELWEPGAFSLAFAKMVKRARLPHVRFHDLRHSFGTLALSAGVDLKTVSAALGHSTIAMTANTYVHAVEALQSEAAGRIDTLLRSAVEGATGSKQDAGRGAFVPQACQSERVSTKKPRRSGDFMVAPTGVEPVSPP